MSSRSYVGAFLSNLKSSNFYDKLKNGQNPLKLILLLYY